MNNILGGGGSVRDISNIREISLLELLIEELPHRVGAPLSQKNLSNVLQVSFDSIDRWIKIFEQLYICLRISPFGSKKIRAVKKEQKLYLWDWSKISVDGFKFENLVACQLLKYCNFIQETQGEKMELRFLRDTDRREVDFVVLKNSKPEFAVECKTGERGLSPHISYFKQRTSIPKFYQVHLGTKDIGNENTSGRILPFLTFCKELEMP